MLRLGEACANNVTVTSAGFAGSAAVLAAIAWRYATSGGAVLFSAPTSWATPCLLLSMRGDFLGARSGPPPRARVDQSHARRLRSEHAVLLTRAIRAAGAAACLLAAWFTGNATLDQFHQGIDTISAYPVPKWWVSIFIPYGMLSSGLYFLRALVSHDSAGAGAGLTP